MKLFYHVTLSTALVLTLGACSYLGFSDNQKQNTTITHQNISTQNNIPSSPHDMTESEEMAIAMGEQPKLETQEIPTQPITPPQPSDETPLFGADKFALSKTQNTHSQSGIACPEIILTPESKSITYFDETNIVPTMLTRASIVNTRTSCDVTSRYIDMNIDIIMQAAISDKGRFNGDKNAETFQTFPYFITLKDKNGRVVDSDIMATLVKFNPTINYVDHAEQITQRLPITQNDPNTPYTLTIGFQLNTKQMGYNKAETILTTNPKPASKDVSPVAKRSYNPLAD